MDIEGILKEVGSPPAASRTAARPMRRVPGVQARDWTLPGFGPLTRVTTAMGEVPAQALRERDLVRTCRGDFKPIQWIDRISLDEEFISLHPDALPVHIRANALGRGVPNQDVYLAPRQRIDARATKLAGAHEVALDLVGRHGVFRKAEAMYTYTLFHLGTPEVIQASRMFLHVDV
jgi:hypothetical protein